MKEGREIFNPFAGKKGGKEDEGRSKGTRKRKGKRRKGERMMKGRT